MCSAKSNLLQSLINSAEKAANIARICRSNEELLSLLVQEKTGTEANARFEHDFKTLADVLIQETIKNDIGALFPSMHDAIKGEESPNFTNKEGEKVTIQVGNDETETAVCLQAIMPDHLKACTTLAAEVHRDIIYQDEKLGNIPDMPDELNYADLGIWIDPIDGTAEYINGDSLFTSFPGITSTGLDCVTVLIGVYVISTGVPVIGIVSQPFKNRLQDNVYKSEIYWGVALPNLTANNINVNTENQTRNLLGIFSTSEKSDILETMKNLGYEFVFSAGAGHKALKVITGEVDIYLLSKGSTFRWDTCAPQAILSSCNGDILNLKESIKQQTPISLNYSEENINKDNDWKCNKEGLIAMKNMQLLDDLLKNIQL